METKTCTQCGIDKPLEDYYDKLSECKPCKIARDVERSRRDPRSRMVATARYRSKQLGIPCDITKDDIEIPEYCPLLGIKLKSVGDGKRSNSSPSLDKLDPTKGYVKGNVWVISDKANRMKQDLTLDMMRHMIETIENKLKENDQ